MRSADSTNPQTSTKAAKGGTFDTSIKAWLAAMQKAKKIKPGGKLMFINTKQGGSSE
jgi:hypothetical protein